MDDKLSSLKEKQQELSDKISLLQETNKRKDEEAAEISKLIAECRENLNRIKGIAPDMEPTLTPCTQFMLDQMSTTSRKNSKRGSADGNNTDSPSAKDASSSGKCGSIRGSSLSSKGSSPSGRSGSTTMKSCAEMSEASKSQGDQKGPCGSFKPPSADKKRCSDLMAKSDSKPSEPQKKKKGRDAERVSCKVDLNKMKVRIRGPSEDLKKLDATQLINLLEKFQCQELIINTGEEIIQDPGEIRLVYLLHPGNLLMVAGIVMMAFLINANVCNEKRSSNTQFLLNTLYLSSFAFHFGMVLWMTFIRGYALKFGLGHDTYHSVDNLILPKYFSLCVLLSALSLYSFLATHCVAPCSKWPLDVLPQVITVVVTFFMELITICYIVPAIIKLREATDDYQVDDDEPEGALPESYEKNLVKLGKLNWTICLINFLTLMFLGANIYYLTTKLSLGS